MLIQSTLPHAAAPAYGDPELAELLVHTRPCAVSFYRPGKIIYAQGAAAGPLYLVEYGTVRICKLTADGRRQISAFHFAGEVFGFESGDIHHSYAESVDSAGIRLLRPNSSGGLGVGVLLMALRSLMQIEEHLLLLGKLNAAEKLAAFLLEMHTRQDAALLVDLTMQRNDIADYLGLTFETISRVLKTFKDARIIRLSSISQVEILDLVALKRLAGQTDQCG